MKTGLACNRLHETYPDWEPIIFDDHGQPACSSPEEETQVWADAITDGVFDRLFNHPQNQPTDQPPIQPKTPKNQLHHSPGLDWRLLLLD